MTVLTIPMTAALAVTTVAAVTDVRTRRIPNWLTFGAAAVALAVAVATRGMWGAADALAGWLVGTLLFLPVFVLRGMGAGDVKLLAAIGAWLGPDAVLHVALSTAIAGGVIGLVVALSRGYLRTALRNIRDLVVFWRTAGFRPAPALTLDTATAPRLAYAVPTLVGTVVTLWLR